MRFGVLLLMSLASIAAYADEPRTVDMTTVLKDPDGKTMRDAVPLQKGNPICKGADSCIVCVGDSSPVPSPLSCPATTVGTAIARALTLEFRDEPPLTGDQKWSRAEFASKIKGQKEAVIDEKSSVLIGRLVGKAYDGNIIGQIMPLILPKTKVPELQ
jgi:hypothetical protein